MGIGYDIGRHIIRLKQNIELNGSVLTLGKQDIIMNYHEYFELLSDFGLARYDSNNQWHLSGLVSPINVQGPLTGAVQPENFFKMMGFDEIISTDFSDHEGADVIYDLNYLGLEKALGRQFDVVIDCGTMEHIFHVPNVLENIFHSLKIGGYIIHHSPMNNLPEHGFYQFSPTFFKDYYDANYFEMQYILIDETVAENNNAPRFFSEYNYERFKKFLSRYYSSGKQFLVFCVAKKTERSTPNNIPCQSFYRNIKN